VGQWWWGEGEMALPVRVGKKVIQQNLISKNTEDRGQPKVCVYCQDKRTYKSHLYNPSFLSGLRLPFEIGIWVHVCLDISLFLFIF
jgi:hypothetical protein